MKLIIKNSTSFKKILGEKKFNELAIHTYTEFTDPLLPPEPITLSGYSQQFIKWLVQNSQYNLFYNAFKVHHRPSSVSIDEYLTETEPENYINEAFRWAVTDLGGEYWRTLGAKWDKKLEVLKC